jgi:hypothetical protein
MSNAWKKLREAILQSITPLVGRIIRFFNGPPS